jgi:hypothetical protein
MRQRDLAASIIGLLVFALGIVILVISFLFAYNLFTSQSGLAIQAAKPGGPAVTTTLSRSALSILIKVGALFIMVLVGSQIASRGIQMYFAGERLPRTGE